MEENGTNDPLDESRIINSDVDFCSFYYKAVNRLFDIGSKANVSYLYRYAKVFNNYFNICSKLKPGQYEDQDEIIIQLLKDSFYYRLFYIYRNATVLSSAVAFHFLNVYKQDSKCIEKLLKKKLVKICSIGGCSVRDIVAIVMVLKSIASKNDTELDFRVTILDFNLDWKNTCMAVLSCLKEFHEGTWKINFIECDLSKTKSWTEEILKAIEEADIATMVRFDSKLHHKQNIIKVLCKELKNEAMLFILDCPYIKFIEFCLGINDLGDFNLIHAELYDYHTLGNEALKHLSTLYQKHFRWEKHLRINVSFSLFVCVWMKVSSEACTKHGKNLECIFKTNTEKYNPKQNFLSAKAFIKWENLFTEKKKAAGWNAKGIKKVVLQQKEKKNDIFGKFIPQKKGVHSLQSHLSTQVQTLENDDEEFSDANEESLGKYLNQKRQYSLIKKNAYFSALTANNFCSMFE